MRDYLSPPPHAWPPRSKPPPTPGPPPLPVVYVAGPYRSSLGLLGVAYNIATAWMCTHRLWDLGVVPICPHLNSAFMSEVPRQWTASPVRFDSNEGPPAISGSDPIMESVFLDGDLELVRRCDAVYLLPGWGGSRGACQERHLALDLKLPVFDYLSEVKAWLKVRDRPCTDT